MIRTFTALGSINLFLAVALGAFGAHVLKTKLSTDMLNVYQTGVHYHMIHALGLLLIAILGDKLPQAAGLVLRAGWLLFAGIVLFSGSLYALSISGINILGVITPFGGIAFLLGWASLAMAAWKGGQR